MKHENIEITYKQNKETEYVPPLRAPIESRCLFPLSLAMEWHIRNLFIVLNSSASPLPIGLPGKQCIR